MKKAGSTGWFYAPRGRLLPYTRKNMVPIGKKMLHMNVTTRKKRQQRCFWAIKKRKHSDRRLAGFSRNFSARQLVDDEESLLCATCSDFHNLGLLLWWIIDEIFKKVDLQSPAKRLKVKSLKKLTTVTGSGRSTIGLKRWSCWKWSEVSKWTGT